MNWWRLNWTWWRLRQLRREKWVAVNLPVPFISISPVGKKKSEKTKKRGRADKQVELSSDWKGSFSQIAGAALSYLTAPSGYLKIGAYK